MALRCWVHLWADHMKQMLMPKSKPSQGEKARRREEDFTVLVQLRAAWPGWLQVDSDRAARVTEICPARWRLMKLYKADTRAWHSMRAGLYILPVWTMSFAWQMKVYIFSTRSICDPGTAWTTSEGWSEQGEKCGNADGYTARMSRDKNQWWVTLKCLT